MGKYLTEEQLRAYWHKRDGLRDSDPLLIKEGEGNKFAAGAIALAISNKYPRVRVVPLYDIFETPSTKKLLLHCYGVFDGGDVSPLQIDEITGNLTIPLFNSITKKLTVENERDYLDGFFLGIVRPFLNSFTSKPNGDLGELLMRCKRTYIMTFDGTLSGPTLGFGRIPNDTLIIYKKNDLLERVCQEVSIEVNSFAFKDRMMAWSQVENAEDYHSCRRSCAKKH